MKMMVVTESFELDGELYKAGITRCVPEHEAVQRFPKHFKPARGSGLADRSGSEYRMHDQHGRGHALYTAEQVADALEQRKGQLARAAARPESREEGTMPYTSGRPRS